VRVAGRVGGGPLHQKLAVGEADATGERPAKDAILEGRTRANRSHAAAANEGERLRPRRGRGGDEAAGGSACGLARVVRFLVRRVTKAGEEELEADRVPRP